MKKFTKIIICLLLCVVSLCFVACDNRTDKEKAFTYPKAEDVVYGNGGYAVQKGNYLYFVNGFVGVEDEENVRNGNFTHGALMLTKLDKFGNIVTDENNLLDDDYYITMSSRLSGFEATNLYISGDYLYFTAVCQEDESGKDSWAKDRVDFCRIKLDKTSEVERVYVSETKFSEVKCEYYESEGNTFILVYENGTYIDSKDNKEKTLVRVDCNAKTSTIIKDKVQNAVLNKNGNKIFFVASEGSEYTLYAYNIYSHQTTAYKTWSSSVEVKLVGEQYVYVTYTQLGKTVLGRANNDINNISTFENVYDFVDSSATFAISETGDQVIMIKGAEMTLAGSNYKVVDTDSTEITFIGITNGSIVYLNQNKDLKIVSYAQGAVPVTIATALTFEEGYFDISADDAYIYYYKTVGNHKYLHRIQIVNAFEPAEEMVGVYIDNDAESLETEKE